MNCPNCATLCNAIGVEPYVIFICDNCGQVVDPEKTPQVILEREQAEEYWR
jgi:hypothetical protein